MIGYGLIALVLCGVLGYSFWTERQKHRQFGGVETSSTKVLHELHQTANAAAGLSAYRELVEVDGQAHPGANGPLKAPISGQDCVWFMQKVTRETQVRRRDSDGNERWETQRTVVTDDFSKDPFVVRDNDGEITVVPSVEVEEATRSVNEFRNGERGGNDTEISIGSFKLNLGSGRENDMGYKYEEWILPVGTRVFVSGQAQDRNGALEIRDPGDQKMVISTRTEDELVGEQRKKMLFTGGGSAVAGVVGVGCLITGAVQRFL